MFKLHVLEFARMRLSHDLVPQNAGLHHVALFHRRDFVAPLARKLEGDARDALDFVGVVDLRVDGALLAIAEVGDGFRFAEINAAGEFAQNDDIETVHDFPLERRGIGERRIADRGTDVGEQAQILAQPQQPRFGAFVVGHLVPLRPADGTEDDRVCGLGLVHGGVGDRHLMGVVAGAANKSFFGLERAHAVGVHPRDELFDFSHHFGADAIAGKQKEFVNRHEGTPRHY